MSAGATPRAVGARAAPAPGICAHRRRCRVAALLACALLLPAAHGAEAEPALLTLREYLDGVAAGNVDLRAQLETVNAAQAAVSVAGVRPDPQFSGGIASKELSSANKPSASTATTAGLAFTFETAGKRDARIKAANSNVALTQATLALFRRQLDADAAAAFVEACRTRATLARKASSLAALREVVRANEKRYKAGDIGRVELTQSQVEAQRFEAEVVSAEADVAAAEISVGLFLGQPLARAYGSRALQCEQAADDALPQDIDALVQRALQAREDMRAAQAAIDNARNAVELARANRWVDPVVNVGLTNTPTVPAVTDAAGNVTNTPAARSLTLGLTLSVPIPLSRLQQGELLQAESALTQAQLQARAVALKAEGDVRASAVQYAAATKNLRAYSEHLLADTERVLQGMRTSYAKGATSLLELLSAQRTADEVYVAWLQARADRANARVRLLLSTGARPEL